MKQEAVEILSIFLNEEEDECLDLLSQLLS